MDEGLNVSKDIPKPKRLEAISFQVKNILFNGVLIGVGVTICTFGIVQNFMQYIFSHEKLDAMVRQYWFNVEWWYWLGPMGIFIIMYFVCYHYGKKKLLRIQ